MHESILASTQEARGASFLEHFGWRVPLHYGNVAAEYQSATTSCVVFEQPYLGYLRIQGGDRVDLLHRITTNELRKLAPGEGQNNIFTNEKGRIVDRVALLNFPEAIDLVTSANCNERVMSWIDRFVFIEDLNCEDLTDKKTVLTLLGPESSSCLGSTIDLDPKGISDSGAKMLEWRDRELVVRRADSELHVQRFDLIVDKEIAEPLWGAMLQNGCRPCGLEAYEVLRIESGWPQAFIDFDEKNNPHEVAMLPFVDFDKGCYVGQEVVARLDTYEKVKRRLFGMLLEGDQLPNPGDAVEIDGDDAGYITSSCHSRALEQNIALASIRAKYGQPDAKATISSDGTQLDARICELPFRIKK